MGSSDTDAAFWIALSVILISCVGIIVWFIIVGRQYDRPANNYTL